MTLLKRVQQLALTEATLAVDYTEAARSYLELCGDVQPADNDFYNSSKFFYYVELKVTYGDYEIFVEYYKQSLLDSNVTKYVLSFNVFRKKDKTQVDNLSKVFDKPISLSRFSSLLGSWLKKICLTLSTSLKSSVLSDLVKSYMYSQRINLGLSYHDYVASLSDIKLGKAKGKYRLTATYISSDTTGQITLEELPGSKEVSIQLTIDELVSESIRQIKYSYKPPIPFIRGKVISVESAKDLKNELYNLIGGLSKIAEKYSRERDIKLPTASIGKRDLEITGAVAVLSRFYAYITPRSNLEVNFPKLFMEYLETVDNVRYNPRMGHYVVFPPRDLLSSAVSGDGSISVKKIRSGLKKLVVKYVKDVYKEAGL